MRKTLKSAQKRTARERINTLFEQASLKPRFAKRYVALARRIATRYKVRIPERWRRRFCKECNAFWVPGRNCTVRKRGNKVVMTCRECGWVRRITTR